MQNRESPDLRSPEVGRYETCTIEDELNIDEGKHVLACLKPFIILNE